MKWYFALSEASINRADHAWTDLIHCAVASAAANTTLRPFMLYDGQPSAMTRDLESRGVTVIHIRVPFYDELLAHSQAGKSLIDITSGCYLRTQIPLIEAEDPYVLYTDCDVLFLKDPDFSTLRPAFFAVAPEGDREDFVNNMNSGVMLINCEAMRETYSEFENFIARNLDIGLDQEHYKAFYRGKWDRLDNRFNWKPYWGTNPDAVILHWHGPKPIWIKRYFAMDANHVADIWQSMAGGNVAAYWHFLHEQRRYSRLPELAGAPSPIRIIVKRVTSRAVEGYIYNTVHKRSPVCVDVLLDGSPTGSLNCDSEVLGLEVAGFDGSIYRLELPTGDRARPAAVTFVDKEAKYIAIAHGDRIESSLSLV